jgi:hypothetical protein
MESRQSLSGKAGSLSRFALGEEFLYTVNESNLLTFDISSPAEPKKWTSAYVGWGLETIFKKDYKLYIGSMSAMYIYGVYQEGNPVYMSEFFHATSCDPVVVEGNYAYVTLRSGSPCRTGNNALNIIDISNPYEPKLRAEYAMLNPHGLAVQNSILFICEGRAGLKIFNAENPDSIRKLAYLDSIEAIDIIVENDIASIIGYTHVWQFRITNPENPEFLSRVDIIGKD